MRKLVWTATFASVLALGAEPAASADPVENGFITTLDSGIEPFIMAPAEDSGFAGVLNAAAQAAAAEAIEDRLFVGVGTGLLGLSLDAGLIMSDKLSIRANMNYAHYEMPSLLSLATRIAGIPYDYDLRLLTVGALADYHVVGSATSGNSLYLTGGAYYNANRFMMISTPLPSTMTMIGDGSYNDTDVGTLTDELTFRNAIAPYIGVGAETTFFLKIPVSVYTRFGVLFQGPANARLTASGGGVSPTDIAIEEKQIEDSVGFIETLPLFVVGAKLRF